MIRWSLVRVQAGPFRKALLFTLSRGGKGAREAGVRTKVRTNVGGGPRNIGAGQRGDVELVARGSRSSYRLASDMLSSPETGRPTAEPQNRSAA
jgi:hypothetical protein